MEAQISRTRACDALHLRLHICAAKPELAAVFGCAEEDVGVIELAADLLGNQPCLCHRVERAERTRMSKRGMPRSVRELQGLRQHLNLLSGAFARRLTPAPHACAGSCRYTKG